MKSNLFNFQEPTLITNNRLRFAQREMRASFAHALVGEKNDVFAARVFSARGISMTTLSDTRSPSVLLLPRSDKVFTRAL